MCRRSPFLIPHLLCIVLVISHSLSSSLSTSLDSLTSSLASAKALHTSLERDWRDRCQATRTDYEAALRDLAGESAGRRAAEVERARLSV